MQKKTRFIILIICVILFLVITPYIIIYSLGYRVDFANKKLVATGGIYVKVWPQPVEVYIDSNLAGKTNMLSDFVFMQNLLPKQHDVLVKKDGYFTYQKTIEVKGKEVVKLEHVILFKEHIPFEILTDLPAQAGKSQSPFVKSTVQEKYVIKNNNLYYSNAPENNNITQSKKAVPLLKNILTQTILNNNIIWLSSNGFLYSSDQNGSNTQKLSETALKIVKTNSYKLSTAQQNIFLKNNNNLLLFSQDKKDFQNFYSSVNDFKISPDGQKLLFYNDYEILFSYLNNPTDQIFLNRFSEKIGDCFWLNNDYLIFTLGDKITILETDERGNINMVTLPQSLALTNGSSFEATNPKIFFKQSEGKLYIQTGSTLLSSEKITQ